MATSFEIGALHKQADAGTITDDGLSWMLGWEAGTRHGAYVDAYGGDRDKAGDVPVQATDVDLYRAGWAEGLSAHDNGTDML